MMKYHAIFPIVFLFFMFTAAGCRRETPAQPAPPPPLVTTAVATAADVPVKITEIGTCAPSERVEIKAQVTGKILGVYFEDGADVEAGAILFKIDPAPYSAELARAQAEVVENEARLSDATREWERVKSITVPGAISKQDLDSRKSKVEVAEAVLASSRVAVETSKINLDWCVIRAPITGRLGRRTVDAGNVVWPATGQTLVTIARVDPIYCEFNIPETELPSVREHLKSGALPVEIVEPDTKNKPAAGTLTFWNNEIRRDTGTVLLRATIPNETRRFWPGQFVHASLVLEIHKNAVLVPARAVQISAKGSFVYVVQAAGTAEMRPVAAGALVGDNVWVRDGLAAGEKVVTDGHVLVAPGAPVREAASK